MPEIEDAPPLARKEARPVDHVGAAVEDGLLEVGREQEQVRDLGHAGSGDLREPGREDEETIETGARAAVAGGFTSIACMPNTEPVVDSPAWVEWVLSRAREADHLLLQRRHRRIAYLHRHTRAAAHFHCDASTYRHTFTHAAASAGAGCLEHGIGRLKAYRMPAIKSAVELEMMRQLKALFDPKGILNPGRVLPE